MPPEIERTERLPLQAPTSIPAQAIPVTSKRPQNRAARVRQAAGIFAFLLVAGLGLLIGIVVKNRARHVAFSTHSEGSDIAPNAANLDLREPIQPAESALAAVDPQTIASLSNSASTLASGRMIDLAREAFRRGEFEAANTIVTKLPVGVDSLLLRAQIRERQGQLDFARHYYQQVIALDPKNLWARQGLDRLGPEAPKATN